MLTPRQETILELIVDEYVHAATPISSETIARRRDLGVSPATVRNEVAVLEEEGYITRPHPSAGSVPADKAYRFFVESVASAQVDRVPATVRWAIRRHLNEVEGNLDEWAAVAASVLARVVGNMAIATFPRSRQTRVKYIEWIHLQDLLSMVIVVLEQARLRRQLLTLTVPLRPGDMEASANSVKSKVIGLTRREIESKSMSLTPLEEQLVDATVLILREEEEAEYRDHYVDGLRNLLNQPEFAEQNRARSLVERVEDGSLPQAVLEETPVGSVVKVVIGEENRGDMLSPLTVVISRYGIPDGAIGALGAVGPTRMQYSKTIGTVKFVSSVLSELVEGGRIG